MLILRRQAIKSTQKHERYSHPCFTGSSTCPPNQISHVHAYRTDACNLFFGLDFIECARFVKQFRITANACYNFNQKSYCHPALRELCGPVRSLPAYCAVYDDWLYLLAKVRLSFGMRKKKSKSIFLHIQNGVPSTQSKVRLSFEKKN